MRKGIYILGVLLVLILLGVGSCRKAGTWLVRNDAPVQADAMVVLMGSMTERAVHAADLYREKVAEKIWVVEAAMDNYRLLERRGIRAMSSSERARFNLIALEIPEDSILILPGEAASTKMEAQITRDYLLSHTDIDTLVLVTSSYHTQRAYKLFHTAMKSMDVPVVLYCSPSTYSRFNADRWWRRRQDIEYVLMEYLKLANFYLFEKRELRKSAR
jgi:uncharacterized SAM-binding protein YcdF (DUF218 family)